MRSELVTQNIVDFGFHCGSFIMYNPITAYDIQNYIDTYPQGTYYLALDDDKSLYLFRSTPYTVDGEDFWDSNDGSIHLGKAKIFWDYSHEWMSGMVPISRQEFIKQWGLK